MNHGSTEMMSTERASVTKWKGKDGGAGRENVAKKDLWKEEIRERERKGGGGEFVMKERRMFGDYAAFVGQGERNKRWVRFPCASASTLLIHRSHLGL